jgi:membrane protein implicated in regulation of membrane protease activity
MTHHGSVLIVIGVLIAVFVVPAPWGIPLVVGAIGLEIVETLFWMRVSRRHAPRVGVETLIGTTGRVIQPCLPVGTVRIGGEIWQARCDEGADRDERVRVRDRDRLILIVEPA